MSDNGTFLLWMPEQYNVRNLILIGKRIPGNDDEAFQQFEKCTVLDSIANPFAREFGTRIILYENGNDRVNEVIGRGIKEMKNQFRRMND